MNAINSRLKSWLRLWSGVSCLVSATMPALSDVLIDPTAPLQPGVVENIVVDADNAAIVLDSTIIGEHTKIAIINGRKYRLRDTVNEYVLTIIEYNRVVLRHDREEIQLHVLPNIAKEW